MRELFWDQVYEGQKTFDNGGKSTVTDHERISLWVTEDGGKNWESLIIESPQVGWTMAYAPQIQDDQRVFYVGQDGYQELQGILYKYVSEDQGKTWKVEGQVVL